MIRRPIGRSAWWNAAQGVLAAALLAAIGCAPHEQSPPKAGDYPRSRVQLKQGRRRLPVPTEGPLADALPTSMKVDNNQGFALESDETRLMSGKYRLERDSIIFDQYVHGEIRRAFTGRAFAPAVQRRGGALRRGRRAAICPQAGALVQVPTTRRLRGLALSLSVAAGIVFVQCSY